MALRSRQCLIEDIKCLETKLSHLQQRFDLIVNWIRSQYCEELSGLPDYVVVAVRGDEQSSRDISPLEKPDYVKVEYDNSDDSSYSNTSQELETDNRGKNLVVKLDDEILKDIEAGPVSRLRMQLQKRKLACRISDDEKEQRSFSFSNLPATTVSEDATSFPLLFEGEHNVKWENDQVHDENSTDCNDVTTYDENELDNSRGLDPLTSTERAVRDTQSKKLSTGINKRIKKTAKHIQANREKGLILDAAEYKQMVASLPKGRLNCAVCNKQFSTPTQVRRHELEVHITKEERNKLRIRGSSIPYIEKPKDVATVATMCDICHLPFKNIESHKINHLPSEVMATVEGSWRPHYRCLKCDLLFSDKKKYLAHVTRDCKVEESLENSNYAHHTLKLRTEKNFLCNECGRSFNRKHTLKLHELAVHVKKRDFKCKYCGKTFVIEYLKNCHEKKHLGTSSVTCDLCGFSFTSKQTLRKHIKGVHENRRPYQCQLCDKSFKTSNARNYHVNTHGNPNGRKRGLNREVDPIKAAAKRRHCITWIQNRLQPLAELTTTGNDSENATDAAAVTKE